MIYNRDALFSNVLMNNYYFQSAPFREKQTETFISNVDDKNASSRFVLLSFVLIANSLDVIHYYSFP